MNKKYIIGIIVIIILISISIIFKIEEKDIENSNSKVLENIKPISKETVIKILKSEYGDFIDIDENDIKKVGDNYIVEVFVSIEDDEDSGHTHSEDEGNIHKSSLGVHKINIYTGELEFTK
mgnify:CR=1 FL=1